MTLEPFPPLGWVVVPVAVGGAAAFAAVGHYAAAARRDAPDTPNLPMAMLGGAVGGFLGGLAAVAAWHAFGRSAYPYAVGALFAGLGGEYFGGRCDTPIRAVRAAALAALVLFPFGAGLMSLLR
jgi:hypothetical protein